MTSVKGITRRVLLVVALLATMHGLLHMHALGAAFPDDTGASQKCVLCVSTQSVISVAAAQVAPPAAECAVEPVRAVSADSRIADEPSSSRAPPRA